MSTFEAVVLRYMPDEGSGEVLNVGLCMRLTDGSFFRAELSETWRRVTDAFPGAHAPTVRQAFVRLRDALHSTHPIGQASLVSNCLHAELQRLVPSPDGSVKWSAPIEGVTSDPHKTFYRLMHRYVGQHERERGTRPSRTDEEVGQGFLEALDRRGGLQRKLAPRVLKAPKRKFEVEVAHCWKNGLWNCVQPVSLDLVRGHDIQSKAAEWIGNVRVISPAEQQAQFYLLVGLPTPSRPDAHEAALEALAALRDEVGSEAHVVEEAEADELAAKVEADLAHADA